MFIQLVIIDVCGVRGGGGVPAYNALCLFMVNTSQSCNRFMGHVSEQKMKEMNEAHQVKKAIKSQDEEVSFKEEVLNKQKAREEIINNLLGIRRIRAPVPGTADENGAATVLKEYVRIEEPKGTWKRVDTLSDDEWTELKNSGGILNEEGVEIVNAHISSLSNNIVSLSNLGEAQIKRLAVKTTKEISLTLSKNPERYGIEDPQTLREVCTSMILPVVLAGLQAAENGKWFKELMRNTNAVVNFNDEEEAKNMVDNIRDML